MNSGALPQEALGQTCWRFRGYYEQHQRAKYSRNRHGPDLEQRNSRTTEHRKTAYEFAQVWSPAQR